jgi:DNA modification methylase
MTNKTSDLPFDELNGPKAKERKIANDKLELFDETGKSRGYYSTKNRLNDLTGKEWVYWSKSVITKQYPPNYQHALRNEHGGQKPPDLCADLIRMFTKKGQMILDPFMGVGGTLLGASIAGRSACGIEINARWIEVYAKVCELEGVEKQRAICGDSKSELAALDCNFDFLLTDVPYWNMDKLEKSKAKYKKTGELAAPSIKSKLSAFNEKTQTKEEWLSDLAEIFALAYARLKKKAYAVVFIGEMYRSGRYHFLPYELALVLEKIGFVAKANFVWYDVSNSLHVYGYLYDFIPSLIHQNILVFRKE